MSEPASEPPKLILRWGDCPACGNNSFECHYYVMFEEERGGGLPPRSGSRIYARCTACSAPLQPVAGQWTLSDEEQWLREVKEYKERLTRVCGKPREAPGQ